MPPTCSTASSTTATSSGQPMIFTTNKPLAALGQVLHDGDLAEAILDRLLERGTHFMLRGSLLPHPPPQTRGGTARTRGCLAQLPPRLRQSSESACDIFSRTHTGLVSGNGHGSRLLSWCDLCNACIVPLMVPQYLSFRGGCTMTSVQRSSRSSLCAHQWLRRCSLSPLPRRQRSVGRAISRSVGPSVPDRWKASLGLPQCGQDYGPTGDPFCAPSGEVCESGPMALRMSGQIVPEAQVATYRDEQSPEARSVTLCDGSRIQVTEVSVEERRRIKSIVIR